MSVVSTVHNLLKNDATLTGMLPGGVLAVAEIKRTDDESKQAFDEDTQELLACINVKRGTENPFGPHHHTTEFFFTVSYYQLYGFDVIDAARDRVWQLLHRQRLPGTTDVRCVNRTPVVEDQALLVNMATDSYRAVRTISTA